MIHHGLVLDCMLPIMGHKSIPLLPISILLSWMSIHWFRGCSRISKGTPCNTHFEKSFLVKKLQHIPGLSAINLCVYAPGSSQWCVRRGWRMSRGHGERSGWIPLVVVHQGRRGDSIVVSGKVRGINKNVAWLLHVIIWHAGWRKVLLIQPLAELVHLHLIR